jgi:hypothetical protein
VLRLTSSVDSGLRGNAVSGVASIWRAGGKVVGTWAVGRVSGSTCRPSVSTLRGRFSRMVRCLPVAVPWTKQQRALPTQRRNGLCGVLLQRDARRLPDPS